MDTMRWTSFDLIFFDCDSTLTTIEGIDELAKIKGKELRVGLLTDKAMNGDLDLAEVYGKRLKAIHLTRGELKTIEDRYWKNMVPDAHEVIQALQFLGKQVFIISGGLAESVRGFARRLGVPAENVRAVELEYNELSGDWWRYHESRTRQNDTYLDYDEGPLTSTDGKALIIEKLADGKPGRRLMIGDGSSDLAARDAVDLFVGFGGVIARENVIKEAQVYINSASIAPLLALAASASGYERIKDTPHQAVFDKSIALGNTDACRIVSNELRAAFEREYNKLTPD